MALVNFDTSPFPFRGDDPTKNKPFLDVNANNRLGHTSGRGGVYWEDETYSDQRSLLFIPDSFEIARPGAIVVFFHGNQATLGNDVVRRQQVPRQVAESGLNAVLVAPQFAVNALDSSAGHFWEAGAFYRYIREAGARLSDLYGGESTEKIFNKMPIILVAYSGGYLPAAFSLSTRDFDNRIAGVILFDALYGETDKFANWITNRASSAFFFSAYSKSSVEENTSLQDSLSAEGLKIEAGLPLRLNPGTISFLKVSDNVVHNDFVSVAWTIDPLKTVLSKAVLPISAPLVAEANPANQAEPKVMVRLGPKAQSESSRVAADQELPPVQTSKEEVPEVESPSVAKSFGSYLIWIGSGGFVLTLVLVFLLLLFHRRRFN